jgi:predicted transcriptional regulator of viral defense system
MQNSHSKTRSQALYHIARQQQGLFTTKQALEAGYSRNHHSYHVQAGNWVREMRGIYRLPQFPQDEEDAQLVLWYLWSRDRDEVPQGTYSYETALKIYELSDLMPARLHMTVPPNFRRFNETPRILCLHKDNLPSSDIHLMRGFAVTTPARTIIDLTRSTRIEPELVRQAAKQAISKGMLVPTVVKRIEKALKL